jgi:hypothetical protein
MQSGPSALTVPAIRSLKSGIAQSKGVLRIRTAWVWTPTPVARATLITCVSANVATLIGALPEWDHRVHLRRRVPSRGAEHPRAFALAPGGEIRRCADGRGNSSGDVAIRARTIGWLPRHVVNLARSRPTRMPRERVMQIVSGTTVPACGSLDASM